MARDNEDQSENKLKKRKIIEKFNKPKVGFLERTSNKTEETLR